MIADTAIVTLTIALLAGAVLGRLHGNSGNGATPIGDRVFCGLLAAPLFVFLFHRIFPDVHLLWKLPAATPILIYSLLLAATDWQVRWIEKHFTAILLISVLVFYICFGVALWLRGV